MACKLTATSECALDRQLRPVSLQDMLDDCESEAGSARGTRATRIDPKKSFRYAPDLLLGNTDARIAHNAAGSRSLGLPADIDCPVGRRETNGIIEKIPKNRIQLRFVAQERNRIVELCGYLQLRRRRGNFITKPAQQ